MKRADCADSFHLIHNNKEGIPKPENDLKDTLLFTRKAQTMMPLAKVKNLQNVFLIVLVV